MGMTRRQFLVYLTASAGIVGVPLAVPEALILGEETPKSLIINFDPSKEYGVAIAYVRDAGKKIDEQAYRMLQKILIADARRKLPDGTRFELREPIPTDYGRHYTMAWYTRPNRMLGESLRDWNPYVATLSERDACYVPHSGVYIIGKQIV